MIRPGTDRLTATGTLDASADVRSDGLTGVIWSTGTHSLSLGGRPQRVYVPQETIKPTYDALTSRIQAGEATIGFDHVTDGSVAAETAIGEIGVMQSVRLSADTESIVLTDSEITASNAKQAIESGQLNGYDFSFVGTITPELDASGDRVYENGGAIRVAETQIEQVDVVTQGAVQSAQIGRVPSLAAQARAADRCKQYGITPASEETTGHL